MGASPSHDAPTFVYSTAVASPSNAPKASVELCLVPLLRRNFNPEHGRTLKESFAKIYYQHQMRRQHGVKPLDDLAAAAAATAAAAAADPEAANKMLMKLLVDIEVSFFSTAKVVLETGDLAGEKADAVEAQRAAKREAEKALFDLGDHKKHSEEGEEKVNTSTSTSSSRSSSAANGSVELAPAQPEEKKEAAPASAPAAAAAPPAAEKKQDGGKEERKFPLLRPIPCAVCIIEPDRRKESESTAEKNTFVVNGVTLLSSNAWTGIQGRRLHCVGYVSLFQPSRNGAAAAQKDEVANAEEGRERAEERKGKVSPKSFPFLNEVTAEGIDLEFDIGLLHDDLDFLIDHIIFLASITFRSQYMTSVMAHVPHSAREVEDVYYRHFSLYNIHSRVPKLKHRVLSMLNTLAPLLELVDELGVGEGGEERRRVESSSSRRQPNRRSRSRKPRAAEAKDAIYRTTTSYYPTFALYGGDGSAATADGVEVLMQGDLAARIMKYITDSAAFETVKSTIVRCDMGPLLKERRYFTQVLQDAREERMDSEDEEERLYRSEAIARAIREWIKDGDVREKQSKREEKALRAKIEQLQLQAQQQQQQVLQQQVAAAGLAAAAAAPPGMMMSPNVITYIPGMGYVSVAQPGMMQQGGQQFVMMPPQQQQQQQQQPMFVTPQPQPQPAYPYMQAPQQQMMMMTYPGGNPYYTYMQPQMQAQPMPYAMPFYGRQPQVATMPPTPEQLAALQQQSAAVAAAAAAAAAMRGTTTPSQSVHSGQRPPSVAAESQASTTSNPISSQANNAVGAAGMMPSIKIGGHTMNAPLQQQQHLLHGGAVGSEAAAAGGLMSYMPADAHPFQVGAFHESGEYDDDVDGALAAASEALAALRGEESDDEGSGLNFEF